MLKKKNKKREMNHIIQIKITMLTKANKELNPLHKENII